MASYDIRKLKRTRIIHRVVQLFAATLLVIMGLQFVGSLGFTLFVKTLMVSAGIQIVLAWPLWKASEREADREFESAREGLSPEELNRLRSRRLFSDVIKMAVYSFFLVAIFLLPEKIAGYRTVQHTILSTTIYTFLLTVIAWSQYLTHHLGKRIFRL